MKCATISNILIQGIQTICLHGIFVNISENIILPVNSATTFYGRNARIEDAILWLRGSNATEMSNIYFSNTNFFYSLLALGRVSLEMIDCHFDQVGITDISSSSLNGKTQHIHIAIRQSNIKCSENDSSDGIILQQRSVINLSIKESSIDGCRIHIDASELILHIVHTILIRVAVHINVKSLLRVPSIILLEHSTIELSYRMILDLDNPYLSVQNCTFEGKSLEIVSQDHHFPKHLFVVGIRESRFLRATYDGNGGALYISSDVENSKVDLLDVIFHENKALKILSSKPGNGGAIYMNGKSALLSVVDCIFLDNSAVESGSALFATEGVSLIISNSSFDTEVRQKSPSTVLSVNGEVRGLDGSIRIENVYSGVYSSNFKVAYIQKVSDSLQLSVECPNWYRHYTEHKLITGYSTEQDSTSGAIVGNLLYACKVCSESYYTVSSKQNMLSYEQDMLTIQESIEDKGSCFECPYGAMCSGNDVTPRPNYWGYWEEGQLLFLQCPEGYCCSGSDNTSCANSV